MKAIKTFFWITSRAEVTDFFVGSSIWCSLCGQPQDRNAVQNDMQKCITTFITLIILIKTWYELCNHFDHQHHPHALEGNVTHFIWTGTSLLSWLITFPLLQWCLSVRTSLALTVHEGFRHFWERLAMFTVVLIKLNMTQLTQYDVCRKIA